MGIGWQGSVGGGGGGGSSFTGGTVTTAINFSGLATDITTPGVEDLTIAPGGDCIIDANLVLQPGTPLLEQAGTFGAMLEFKPANGSINFVRRDTFPTSKYVNIGINSTPGVIVNSSSRLGWSSGLAADAGGSAIDTTLFRDGAGIVSQRNGVNSQAHHLFNTWTDASNYERFAIDWQTTANVLRLATEAAGIGTVRDIALMGGDVGIGRTTPDAKLDVDQASTTGAIPVLTLRQADVDEDFLQVIGTSDTNVDRALVDAVDFSTIGALAGYLKIRVQDDQATNPIPDGDYYLAFYAAPSA